MEAMFIKRSLHIIINNKLSLGLLCVVLVVYSIIILFYVKLYL